MKLTNAQMQFLIELEDKQCREIYLNALKAFKGDEEKVLEHFNKILTTQKKRLAELKK